MCLLKMVGGVVGYPTIQPHWGTDVLEKKEKTQWCASCYVRRGSRSQNAQNDVTKDIILIYFYTV